MSVLRRTLGTRWLLLPLLAALAMRVLVPVGWTPVFSGNAVGLAWCSGMAADVSAEEAPPHHSGHGTTPVHEGSHGQTDPAPKPADDSGSSTGVCTFAVSAMAFAGAPAALSLPTPVYKVIDWLFAVIVTIGCGLAAPPPPKTGPPISP